MKSRIIIGANLGDEGKGTVVAHYTKAATGPVLNVLTNGGAQRAHSILTEDGSFTFKHFGSGTYHGADSYFSNYFIINPMQFVKEFEELTSRGVTINKIYRHPDCRWTTPYDMMANQILEELRGERKHGSCGMGIWETVKRHQAMFCFPIDVFNIMEPTRQKAYLYKIREYFERFVPIPDHWKEAWESPILMENFINDCKFLINNTTTILNPYDYEEIIYENGQGLMLCDTGKDIAGTTPSLTNSKAVNLLTTPENVTVHYVTRPYLTRHGKGFLNEEQSRTTISGDIEEDRTNHHNTFQDNFRYGVLNLETLKARILQDRHPFDIEVELTHCDEMDRVAEFKRNFKVVNTYDTPLI